MNSFFMTAINNEDLLMGGNEVEVVDPSSCDKMASDLDTNFNRVGAYLGTVDRPLTLIDTLRENVDDGDYAGAIATTGSINESLNNYVEVESFTPRSQVMGYITNPKRLDMLDIHNHLIAYEGFISDIGDKIKAFFKWCYDKIASIGTMIKGWFSGSKDDSIKSKLEAIKDKRINEFEVKGESYTYNGDKPLTSSVQLASSAGKVSELFKRYSDYIGQINTHLNELASDEGRLSDTAGDEGVLNSFIANVNKVIADKKTDEAWLGFTLRPANRGKENEGGLFSKVIFTLRGQKVDKKGSSTESDNPVTPNYKMSVSGKDLASAHEHFMAAEKTAQEFSDALNKLMSRLKVVETTLSNKADDASSAKLYKSVRVALEVSGDTIKNIADATTRLATAKNYWCVTVVNAVSESSSSDKDESKQPKKDEPK